MWQCTSHLGGAHLLHPKTSSVEVEKPFNADYFKSLWTRYKAQSRLISPDQTLYSFRHTGAISVYEKTGNLRTVQTVMGHASMAVTLGYLRGLEVCALNADEMPRL